MAASGALWTDDYSSLLPLAAGAAGMDFDELVATLVAAATPAS